MLHIPLITVIYFVIHFIMTGSKKRRNIGNFYCAYPRLCKWTKKLCGNSAELFYYPEHFDSKYKIKSIIAIVPNVPELKQPNPPPKPPDVFLKAWKSFIFPPLPLFQSITKHLSTLNLKTFSCFPIYSE